MYCIHLKNCDYFSFSKNCIGNKGFNLLALCQLGIKVPEGFIIPIEICRNYLTGNKSIIDNLKNEIITSIHDIELSSGKKLGDENNPLIFSIRSGASVSMPGMLDTILNVGLNERILLSCRQTYLYQSYLRFIISYAKTVKKVFIESEEESRPHSFYDKLERDEILSIIGKYKKRYKYKVGELFPEDPLECIINCIIAVFNSWENEHVEFYRKNKGIPHNLYTAVIVQRMVFGNLNTNSGTGVIFTSNPINKKQELYGEYLAMAQGEDIVSGISNPNPIEQLLDDNAEIYHELKAIGCQIENHFGCPQDIEFTYEDGKVYVLQARDMPILSKQI